MKYLQIILTLALAAITLSTTVAHSQSIPLALDAHSTFASVHTDFGEQWNSNADATLPQFTISTITDNRWRVRYSFVPGWNSDATFTPSGSFVVGDTQFVKQKKNDDKKTDQKPVFLQWHHGATHRLEFVPWFNSPIRPLAIVEWRNVSLTASGKIDDKAVEATDEWRATLWAMGALLHQQQGNRLVELSACAGDRLVRCEAMLMWRIEPGINISGGYSWAQWRIGELRMRETSPYVGIRLEGATW